MDKFPFTRDVKQPAFALSLLKPPGPPPGPFPHPPPRPSRRHGQPELLAVSEKDRIVVYWAQPDGHWGSFVREHREIGPGPAPPSKPQDLRFSRNVGLAAAPDGVLLAYRRRIGNAALLYIDGARFDAGATRYAPAPEPIPVPLTALGFEASGLDIWLDHVDGRLLLLVQTFNRIGHAPLLTLLTAPLSHVGDLDTLAGSGAWKAFRVDGGGFDFTARRDGQTLHAVHRREDAAFFAEQPFLAEALAGDNDETIIIQAPELIELDLETPLQARPLVWASIDIDSGAAQVLDDALPGGEHPLIASLDPMWVTVTRHTGLFVTARGPPNNRVEFSHQTGGKFLLANSDEGWSQRQLYDAPAGAIPGNLRPFARAQLMLQVQKDRLVFSTLFDTDPVQCVGVTADPRVTKGELVLMRHDGRLGALALTRFQVSPAGGSETGMQVEATGQAILDINHHVGLGSLAVSAGDPELGQFAPAPAHVNAPHPDGYDLNGDFGARLHMGGLPTAEPVGAIHAFAYTDMGDGGVRVVLPAQAELPPLSDPGPAKTFDPATVPDLGDGAWIELDTASPVPLALPRYRIPYADFLRSALTSDRELPVLAFFALLVVVPQILVEIFEPRSIVLGAQPALDALPELSAIFLGTPLVEPPAPNVLTQQDAANLQRELVKLSSPAAGNGQIDGPPFALSFDIDRSFLMEGSAYVLTANLPPLTGAPTVAWTVTFFNDAANTAIVATLTAPTMAITIPAGTTRMQVDVTATAAEGTQTSTHEFAVQAGLWTTVTTIYSNLTSTGGVTFGSLTADLGAITLDFKAANGVVSQVTVSWPQTYAGDFRFFEPPHAGQGEVELRLPLHLSAPTATPTGDLGWAAGLVDITNLDVQLLTRQRFTPGVLTSDRRIVDPVRGGTFHDIDRQAGRSIRGMPDVETVTAQGSSDAGGVPIDFGPAALAAKPAGALTVKRTGLNLQVTLSAAAKTVGMVVMILATLGLLAVIAPLLIVALLVLAGPAAAAAIFLGVGVASLIALAFSIGLGWLLLDQLVPPLLTDAVKKQVRQVIDANLPAVAATLNGAGFARYTGEGVAEAIATATINAAGAQAPAGAGRDRFRPQFFRMIVASRDRAKVQVAG